jgi:hypothetical protein
VLRFSRSWFDVGRVPFFTFHLNSRFDGLTPFLKPPNPNQVGS